MQTQTCRLCQVPDVCTEAQFCRYPLVGKPEFISVSDADLARFDKALIASSEFLYELKV